MSIFLKICLSSFSLNQTFRCLSRFCDLFALRVRANIVSGLYWVLFGFVTQALTDILSNYEDSK